jgi:deoxyribodipyrimidine photo-lyase
VPTVLWFRRDLRLRDNPALTAALADDGRAVPLFVLDPALWSAAGPVRQAYLVRSLQALDHDLDGRLLIRHGDPRTVVPDVVRAAKATSVHVAADFAPYGARRDADVETSLRDVSFVRTGSPYAVAPGRVRKEDGTPYRVFTPYYRAWCVHGWRAPVADPSAAEWFMPQECDGFPAVPELGEVRLPPAGERAAWARWEAFREVGLAGYADRRNRPDLDGTSALSHHLRFGEIHPRSLLAELTPADEVFQKELCWREFYADVLHQFPDSARMSLDPRFDQAMRWSQGPAAEDAWAAWQAGTTGYPLVDAGMRQLRQEGWVHNRVRMVVASFLVKDLHLPWQRGAREFMYWLRDADLASNAHGWQWTAGCGTDAAPFYRVFNPILQGLKFDPDGSYVRHYVPELAHLPGSSAHEPWKHAEGYLHGYPERIVEHAVERSAALADFARLKATPS